MAEFALVLAPCLTLFLGIMNFALALYAYDWVCYSAQQAVRYATVNGTTATIPRLPLYDDLRECVWWWGC